jgi:hypothetical protein
MSLDASTGFVSNCLAWVRNLFLVSILKKRKHLGDKTIGLPVFETIIA